jgi:DNA polymerase-3 subunit delta
MVKIEDLEKTLKENQISSLYLFYGKEKYLLETCLKKIKNAFGQCLKGINYINLDTESIQNLIQELEMPAFGFEKKLIIVKNIGLLKKEAKKKSTELANLKKAINEYIIQNIESIKNSVVLIFIEDEVDKTELYNIIDKNGIVCEFAFQKPIEIKKRLKQICNAYKVNIEESTLQYFIECCGTDMQTLINEIRKLIEYCGENGTITNDVIDILSIKQIESVIFDLTDCLGQKKVKEALEVLHNLIYSKEPIQKILITLYNHLKKIYIVKLCLKYNKDVGISLNLQPNQMFLINKYKNQARFYTEKELKNINRELRDLDYKYKIGLIDLELGLESILCAYI